MAKRPDHYTRAGDLTPRQREVLRMIAAGHTNPEIANRLGISLDGAKFHVREIFARLGVDTREEAAAWWQAQQAPASKISSLVRSAVGLGWAKLAAGGVTVAVAAIGGILLAGALSGGGDVIDAGDTPACPSGTVTWAARSGANPDGSVAIALDVLPTTGEWPCIYRTEYTLSLLRGQSYEEKQPVAADLEADASIPFAGQASQHVVSLEVANVCDEGVPLFVRVVAENDHETLERYFEVPQPGCDDGAGKPAFVRAAIPSGTGLTAIPASPDGRSNTLRALPGEDIAVIARAASHLAGYDVNYPADLPAWRETSYTVTAGSARFDAQLSDGGRASFGISQASYGPPNTTKVRIATHQDGRKIWRNADGSVFIDASPTWQGLAAIAGLDEQALVDMLVGLRPARSLPDIVDIASLPRCDDASIEWLGTFAEDVGTTFTFSGRSNGAPGPCLYDAQLAVAAIIIDPGGAEQVAGSAQSVTWDGNYRQVLTSQFESLFRADLWNVCNPVDGVLFRTEVFVERTGARSTYDTPATPPPCTRVGEQPIFQGGSQQPFPPNTARALRECDLDTIDFQGETSRDATGGIEIRIYAVATGASEPCVYAPSANLSAWLTGADGARTEIPAAGNPGLSFVPVTELTGDYRLFVAGTLSNACGQFAYSTVSLGLRYDAPQDNIIEQFNLDVPSCVSPGAPPNLALPSGSDAQRSTAPPPGQGTAVPGTTKTTLCPGSSCPGADEFLHNPDLAVFVQPPITGEFRCSAEEVANEPFCAAAVAGEVRPGVYHINGDQRERESPDALRSRVTNLLGFPGQATIIAVGDSDKGPIDVVFRRQDGSIVSIAVVLSGRLRGPQGSTEWAAPPRPGDWIQTSFGGAVYYSWQ